MAVLEGHTAVVSALIGARADIELTDEVTDDSIRFYSILFYSILFYFVLFCSVDVG